MATAARDWITNLINQQTDCTKPSLSLITSSASVEYEQSMGLGTGSKGLSDSILATWVSRYRNYTYGVFNKTGDWTKFKTYTQVSARLSDTLHLPTPICLSLAAAARRCHLYQGL